MDLLDLHPEEVARQLTLIEFNLFAKIEVCVCTNKLLVLLSLCNVWSALNCWGRVYQEWLQAKNINNETAPNISALIQRFNEVWNQTRISILRGFPLRNETVSSGESLGIVIHCSCGKFGLEGCCDESFYSYCVCTFSSNTFFWKRNDQLR
jgi:hypothetical protein